MEELLIVKTFPALIACDGGDLKRAIPELSPLLLACSAPDAVCAEFGGAGACFSNKADCVCVLHGDSLTSESI